MIGYNELRSALIAQLKSYLGNVNCLQRRVLNERRGLQRRYSVVAVCYNVELHIDKFFRSMLVDQTVDPACLEIIAIDDGSTDHTAARIRSWQRRFPGNVTLIQQANRARSSARNAGLTAATGAWISFIDADDFVSSDYLEEIDKELSRSTNLDVSVVSCNLIAYHTLQGFRDTHPLRYRYTNTRTTLPADDLQSCILTSVAHAWFLTDFIRQAGLTFNHRILPHFEDAHFIGRYLLAHPRTVVSFLRAPRYFYRMQGTSNSILDTAPCKSAWYIDQLRYGCLDLLERWRETVGRVPRFIQRTVLYDLMLHVQHMLDQPDRHAALPQQREGEFLRLLSECLRHIDMSTINTFELADCREEHRVGLLGLKGENASVHTVFVRAFDSTLQMVQFAFFCTKNHGVSIIVDGEEATLHYSSMRTARLCRRPFFRECFFWAHLHPHGQLTIEIDGSSSKIEGKRSLLGPLATAEELVRGLERQVPDVSSLPRAVRRLRKKILSPKTGALYRNCWLFVDRDTKADNNAEHLYRYVRGNPRGSSAFFLLNKDSPDWPRLEAEGFSLIPFGSDEHCIALAHAEFLVSSETMPNPFTEREFGDLFDYKFVFLQHGVIRDDISRWLNKKNIDLFVTSTKSEYESVASPESPYKFSSKEVILTGLPRHDRLLALPDLRESIFIMPTWRNYLAGSMARGGSRRAKSQALIESEYWTRWNELLHDSKLKELALQFGVRVEFCPHANFVEQLAELALPDHVKLVNPLESESLQPYLAAAAVLITDYSSIAFECAYKNKPVIYYHFDFEEYFRGGHTSQLGYFDHIGDGFGPVFREKTDLLIGLSQVLRGEEDAIYSERRSAAFPFRDQKCCERIFRAMLTSSRYMFGTDEGKLGGQD